VELLVVGATGGLGRATVDEALTRGHEVSALVRDPSEAGFGDSVHIQEGDVLDPLSLAAAVRGKDAVLCALGTPSPRKAVTLLEDGTRNLVGAMEREGVRRLVCVTLLGVGKSRANASFFYGSMILRVLAPMVPDKENQERVVRESGLEWVLVRPPRLVDEKRNARVRVIPEGQSGRVGSVRRQDLARLVVDAAESDEYVGQAVAVGS
jgi:uncharacterized protein YbjT (DUF2867 family)